MNDPGRRGTLEIEVTDFGPIAKAELDLRPLTVFIGPSNTGKSYLAILIYALHSLFAADYRSARGRRGMTHPLLYSAAQDWWKKEDLSEESIRKLVGWLEDVYPDSEAKTAKTVLSSALPDNVAALVRPLLTALARTGHVVNAEVGRCFGVGTGTGRLIRQGSGRTASIVVQRHAPGVPDGTKPFRYDFSLEGNRPELTVSIPVWTPLCVENDASVDRWLLREVRRKQEHPFFAMDLIVELAASTMPHIVGPLSRPAFYLPADRAGVMHAHRVVVGALVDRAASAGLRRAPQVPTLSGVLADFLEELIEMGDAADREEQHGNGLAGHLERDVLEGSIRTELSETRYPSFSYRPKGWKKNLPLMNTSSMVSELAPVVLYLRHLVRRGDTLIIEEPESHLHPAMQAALARHLAGLVHSGTRVIVTTHSEWLLDQFANLVRMSELEEKQRMGLTGGEVALRPDQFGAWMFKPKQRPKGSIVEEIRIDPDAGGLLSDYSDTAEQMYGTWAEIGNRVAESKGAQSR